jgi:fructokinase
MLRIGIDLGGTKIEAVAMTDDGRVQARRRIAAPRDDYDATLAAIGGLVSGLEHETGARAHVGVGMPGAISPATGLVKNANSVWLNGRPLKEDLSRRLSRPLRLANDANCFALSEARDGAGADADVVFGVILGTGTGGGIICRGQVLTGPNAIGGEWGHNPLPWPQPDELPGPPCYCGQRGCIETFVSGPGLLRDHETVTGERSSTHEIVAMADAFEPRAAATMERYEQRLARALASVINVLDPDVIVLGGGLSNITRLYENVPARWGRWVFSDQVDTRLVAPRHGDASGVRGAAWLWAPGDELAP